MSNFLYSELNVPNLPIQVEQGIPCGLILNELLSNSFKHAFTQQKKGKISIHIEIKKDPAKQESILYWTYKDNGVGLPPGIEIKKGNTLGLTLVSSLIYQLDEKFEVSKLSPDGFGLSIQFSYKELSE